MSRFFFHFHIQTFRRTGGECACRKFWCKFWRAKSYPMCSLATIYVHQTITWVQFDYDLHKYIPQYLAIYINTYPRYLADWKYTMIASIMYSIKFTYLWRSQYNTSRSTTKVFTSTASNKILMSVDKIKCIRWNLSSVIRVFRKPSFGSLTGWQTGSRSDLSYLYYQSFEGPVHLLLPVIYYLM